MDFIMGVVFPNEAIARRWDGALQARLRRAPLEEFLKKRSLPVAPTGIGQDSDDLARATVFLLEAGISAYCRYRSAALTPRQRSLLGRTACIVSRAAASQILKPEAWRIAALISTAQLLAPWIGLKAAAVEATCAARLFEKHSTRSPSSLDLRLSAAVGHALTNEPSASEAIAIIALHLDISVSPDRLLTFG